MHCRNCGVEMNDNQAICIKCGVNVGDGKAFCSNCGKPVNENADVCLSCGVAIKNQQMKNSSNAKNANCNGNLFQCYFNAIKNYFNFNGRTSRREYWLFVLGNIIISIILGFIINIIGSYSMMVYVSFGYCLFMVFPSLSIVARRLHDINKSGWLQLLSLTCIGVIPVLIWLCTAGDAGSNNYGSKD